MNRSPRPALPRPEMGHALGRLPRARAYLDDSLHLDSLHLRLVSRARAHSLALLALTCMGFALRVALLDTFPLREDEAIYGFWARTATTDPFFLQVWPDKPPLFIWLLQGAFALFGSSAASTRLVSIFASTLTIPLVAWGAFLLWRSRVAAALAAMLFTFNPFAVSFASTAYTDSLLALLGLGAVVCALRGRGLAAGLLLAAACMTKQQGLLYAPLVVGLLLCAPLGQVLINLSSRLIRLHTLPCHPLLCHPVGVSLPLPRFPERPLRGDRIAAQSWAQLAWAFLGTALVTLPILWWDSQRWAVAPSPWALAQQTYAPLTWLPPSHWWARTQAWTEWLWYLGGSWIAWAMLGAALIATLVLAMRRPALILLVGWGMAFVALHVMSSVQVWDRYLLPLAGWLALVASGPLAMGLSRRLPDWWRGWMRGMLVLLLIIGMAETIVSGIDAARGRLPIGGDHGDYAGLTEAIAWVAGACGGETSDQRTPLRETPPQPSPDWGGSRDLDDNLVSSGITPIAATNDAARRQRISETTVPSPTWGGLGWGFRRGRGFPCPAILYHQVLGWHFRFYFYDELQPQGENPPRFDLRWFPSAAYLADNAAKTPYPPKYLILPEWATPRDLDLHLALRGLTLEPRLRVGRFAVMEITQPPRPVCDWCKSAAARMGAPFAPDVPPMSELPMSEPTTP